MKPHYFVSDLHLGSRDDLARREKFFRFLTTIRRSAAGLFIVGDLFEFGFEFRGRTLSRNIPIAERLADLTRAGIRVMLVKGNHETWLGQELNRDFGIEVLEPPALLDLDGKRFMLAHGDDIDPSRLTRVTRRLFRSRVATALYSPLAERIGSRLAGYVSNLSRARGERPGLMQSLERFAAEQLGLGVDVVVAGHVHRPELKRMGSGWYLNTGDWISRFSYAVLDDAGLRLEYFSG